MTSIPIAEAKAHFSEWVRQAERGKPVFITRHGKPVAALVGPESLRDLQRRRAAGPRRGLASLAGGWSGSEELVRALARQRRTGPRPVPKVD
jgi:prevent-host-death family protein